MFLLFRVRVDKESATMTLNMKLLFKMFDILQSSTKIIWVPKFHPNQIYLWYLILLFVWVQDVGCGWVDEN